MITEEHDLFSTLLPNYYLCKTLGTGRSGTVYLVYHRELEEYRAVKVVPDTMTNFETFRKEALFLKHLRHPGIPLVYDVVDGSKCSNCFMIIEEYLEGESLYTLVKRMGSLSMKMTVDLGIQICRIIQFMNSSENPILYLDLQPKNLLVCEQKVKLIDFDHAQYACEVESFGERYGTIGFAAPEQYRGEPLDCRTDVYAIGALLYFMCRGKPPGRQPVFGEDEKFWELDKVIRGCMAKQKEERYASAKDVEDALQEWNDHNRNEKAIESLTVVFAGAKEGAGTTHASLGFVHFLIRNGYLALYQESYDTDAVRTLMRNRAGTADETGVYRLGRMNLRPYYGKAVRFPYRYYPVTVHDIGTSWKESGEIPDADWYVLVCGGRSWESDRMRSAVNVWRGYGKPLIILRNLASDDMSEYPVSFGRDIPCLSLPFFANPFQKNPEADGCFGRLLDIQMGETGQWKGKRSGRLFKKICRKRNRD